MTLHPSLQAEGEAAAAWLRNVRQILGAAAAVAADGMATEVLVRRQRPMAREVRSIARSAGVQAWVRRSGRYLVVRFADTAPAGQLAGPALL